MNDFNKYGEPRSMGGMKPLANRRNSGKSNRSGMQEVGHAKVHSNTMRPTSPIDR